MYDSDFYKLYSDYLNEQRVVSRHHFAVNALIRGDERFKNVVDFGCGQHNEFTRHFDVSSYVGIDLNASHGIVANYRDKDVIEAVQREVPHAFVSLFSTEITASGRENKWLYTRAFAAGYTAGLVSGFYYANKRRMYTVGEAGGITSWQTIDDPDELDGFNYKESARVTLHVPSRLFGDDVYEVWRLLEKSA